MRIGILGFGKMGEMIAQGLRQAWPGRELQLQGTTRTLESAKDVTSRLAIPCHNDPTKLIQSSEVLVLCTKPHQAKAVLQENARHLSSKKLLISICASIRTELLADWSGGLAPIVRAMPNTPCLIGEGMTVLCAGPGSKAEDLKKAEEIFKTLGKTAMIEESLMDGATGLSGCGPAYVYLMIESLSEAGVKIGLPRQTATLLAAQTLLGASKMVLQRGVHPAALKDEVTTPAGCTIDGLMALEEGKLRVTLIKAVLAATERSRKLSAKQTPSLN